MTALDFFVLCGELLLDADFLIKEDEQLKEMIRRDASLDEVRTYLEENY